MLDQASNELIFDTVGGRKVLAVTSRYARRGLAASIVVHIAAIGLAVAIASTFDLVIAAFGSARPLSITASFSEHAELGAPPEESGGEATIIMPDEAWHDDRHFVNTTVLPTRDRAAGAPARASPPPSLERSSAARPTVAPTPQVVRAEPLPVRRRVAASSQPAIAPVNLPPPDMDFVGRPCRYPEAARRAGWEGTVELLITIAADGTVLDVEIYKSSGHGVLDAEAVQTARAWRAVATRPGGKLWATQIRKPIIFTRTYSPSI